MQNHSSFFEKTTAQLQAAGIYRQDTVIVHSSLKRIGPVEGGGDTILDALMEYFAPGLLVLPTLTYTLFHDFDASSPCCQECIATHPADYCLARLWEHRTPEYHANRTPSCIGVLPNLFRIRPGVVRSLNPSHSVAAIGDCAVDFISGHENSSTPCGKLSPWWKLYLRKAKILHLGSPITTTTYMHGVSEWLHQEQETPLIPNQVTIFDSNEKKIATPVQHITAGGAHFLPAFFDILAKLDIVKMFTFGEAPSLLIDCERLADFFFARGTIEP